MRSASCILAAISVSLAGCFAPVNLEFDSARNVRKGQVEVQASFSNYTFLDPFDSENTSLNFGGRIAYGFSNKFNIKVRFERLKLNNYLYSFSDIPKNLNYFEVENKIGLIANKVSFGIPIGYYFNSNGTSHGFFIFNPKAYITFFNSSNKIELSVIPKMQILFSGEEFTAIPAFSIGIGLSNNLNKWAIRPEIGYNYSLSFGIGLSMKLDEM